MINVYPIKIEAVNENHDLMFRLEAFDEYCATIEIKTSISHSNIDELFAAIREGVDLLRLEGCSDSKPVKEQTDQYQDYRFISEGSPVFVEWKSQEHDWHHFFLMQHGPFGTQPHFIRLKGRDDPDGSAHMGDTFWVCLDEIKRMALDE